MDSTATATCPTKAIGSAKLLPHHLAELRASGLSDATIREAGIYSETKPERLAVLLNAKKPPRRLAPALVLPFIEPEGRNGYARIKPDTPRQVAGKPIKYESPRGEPNRVYLPPGVAALLDKPETDLLVTEGEKKALKATQEGFPCLGLVGVYGWKEARSESLLPSLERVAWQGRRVFLAFDSDAATNPNVRDAETRLAAHLAKRGAEVRIVRLPEGPAGADGKATKQGLDDFLVAAGPAALQGLMREATEPEPLVGDELKGLARTLDPASEAERYLKAAERDGLPKLRVWRGDWYWWTHGCYRETPRDEVRASIVRELNRRWSHLSANITTNVVEQVQALAMLPSATEPPAWLADAPAGWGTDDLLVARNGVLSLGRLVAGETAFLPASPRLFALSALDYDALLDAPEPRGWLEFLDQLWGGDWESVGLLQEWIGYTLTADTRQQKLLLVVGPKRSGKGTIARVHRGLLGPANVAGPTLASFAQNFGLQALIGKPLAIVSDARLSGRTDQAVVVERILSISGEDALTIDRKHRDPWTGRLPTRLMILSNELPRLADASGALAGRFLVLRMTESFFGREDSGLTDRLMAERPGILLWAIEGWHRLRERGYFRQPASGEELTSELADLGSPIGVFVRERCQEGEGCRVYLDELFRAWQNWCDAKGRREPGTEQSFGRDLRAAVPGIRTVRTRDGDERRRAYEGLALRY